jgi:surface protein
MDYSFMMFDSRPAVLPATLILDACCYRNDIPSELRVIIRTYYYCRKPLDNESIREVVIMWCSPLKEERLQCILHFDFIYFWDTSNVTDMSFLFEVVGHFNDNISEWDTSNVTDMSYMFNKATFFNQSLENWNVAKVTMGELFCRASRLNQPLGKWKFGRSNLSRMFEDAVSFNQPLESWNVGKVINMSYMFSGARSFNQPLAKWNIANVKDMSRMFYHASKFNQPLSEWNKLSAPANIAEMFTGATAFNQLQPWST